MGRCLERGIAGPPHAHRRDFFGPALRKTRVAVITHLMGMRLGHTHEPGPEPCETDALSHRRHLAALVVTGLLFAATLAFLPTRPRVVGERASVDHQCLAQLERGVDPDTADWFELAQLPGIGEVLAKRIVAFRETGQTKCEKSGRVFTCAAGLTQVRGVGERTVHRISPFLRFHTGHP